MNTDQNIMKEKSLTTTKIRSAFWISGIAFLVLLLLDQVTKALVRHYFSYMEAPGYPWPGVFELTLTYNTGIAFGRFEGLGIIFTPIALLIAVGSLIYSIKNPKLSWLMHFSLGMLAAGAIGNLIDRLWLNRVTDMLWFRLIDFPVFNIADCCITVSAILLGIMFVFDGKKSEDKKAS